jgi:hypothetical protein
MTSPDAPDPSLVLWFRQDVRRAVRAAWLRAFVFVFLAMAFLTAPLSAWESPTALQVVGWIFGGACLVTGPIYLMVRLQRILAPDIYLAVHRGGVSWHDEADNRFVAWDQIREVRAREGSAGIVLELDGQEDLVVAEAFVDVTSAELAELLTELLQKALLGLPVRPRSWPR